MERGRRRGARSRASSVGRISRALRCGLSKAPASPHGLHREPTVEQGASHGALRGGGAMGGKVGGRFAGRRRQNGRVACSVRGPRRTSAGGRACSQESIRASARAREGSDLGAESEGQGAIARKISSRRRAGFTPTGARCRKGRRAPSAKHSSSLPRLIIAGVSHWPKGGAEALADARDTAEAATAACGGA